MTMNHGGHNKRLPCQTKPIGEVSSAKFEVGEPIVPNEANPGGAGRDGASGTRGERAKRTQFPAAPGGTRDKCAKRSQFAARRISHHSTILSFHPSSPTPIVRNEPNWPAGEPARTVVGDNRAKRSQLRPSAREWARAAGAARPRRRAIVRNEANWGRSFKLGGCRGRPPCLPIRRAATGGRPFALQTRPKAVRTNEANWGSRPTRGIGSPSPPGALPFRPLPGQGINC